MAWFRFRRRLPSVRQMVMALAVVGTLLSLWEEEKAAFSFDGVEEGFVHRPSYSSRRTMQEDGDSRNPLPRLVLEDERIFREGPSRNSRRGEDFEATPSALAADPRSEEGRQLLTNEYLLNEARQRMNISTTPVLLGPEHTTISSFTKEYAHIDDDYDFSDFFNYSYYDYFNSSFFDYYYNDYGNDSSFDYSYHYDCDNCSTLKHFLFAETIFLCEYIYSAMYGEYTLLTDSVVSYGNSSVSVITGERFLDFCVPLLQEMNDCEERDVITVCHPDEVAFVRLHNCQRPSSEDLYFDHLLIATRLEEDDVCFRAACEGNIRVVERQVGDVVVRLISPNVTSCHGYLLKYYRPGANETEVLRRSRNRYWPCCFAGYDVVWMGEPEALASVAKDWSYLPTRCRIGESFLVVMVICIVTGGVTGNLLAVISLVRHGFKDRTSTMIRMSLASADLLLTLFVLVPSLYEHIRLIHSTGSFQPQGIDVEAVDGGFQVFSALMFSFCCIISQLNLFVLSLERLVLARGIAQERVLFTRPRVRGFVIVTWTLSLLVSLVLMSNGDGTVVGLRHSFTKLIFGLSPRSAKIRVPSAMALMGIVSLLTGGFSVQAVRKHFEGKAQQRAAELAEDTETNLDRGGEQTRLVAATMILTTVFYIGSTLMGCVAFIMHLSDARFAHVELICYLCWWAFLGSPAWNPWIYNLPNKQFKDDAGAFFNLLVPRSLLDKVLRCYRTPSRAPDVELTLVRRQRARRQRYPRRFERTNIV